MAQSTQEIQNEIVANVQADVTLAALNSTSKTALWRLVVFVVASVINKLQKLFDTLKTEVTDLLLLLKPHSLRWYAEKCKAFQFGFSLLPDTDKYDNTLFTDAQVTASKVVSYAAVVESENPFGRVFLRIKLATDAGSDLQPLTVPQLAAFKNYMARIKDAGVKVVVDSLPPDKLKNKWKVYYDPLVLSATGARLDGSDNDPVGNSVREYLKKLPFNGVYVLEHHIDYVQLVEGVAIPHLVEAYATYGALPFTAVNVLYEPDAGYLRFQNPADLEIEFVPYNVI